MKKLIGISLFSVVFLAVSCQKEEVKMTETRVSASEAPVWKSAIAPSPEGTSASGATSVGSGITDPNNDPDMNPKKVVKQ